MGMGIRADSVRVHADTPNAIDLVQQVRRALAPHLAA
jgi:lactam utilization protein B